MAAAAGPDCVRDFATAKVTAAAAGLSEDPAFDRLENASADVVVAIAEKWTSPSPAGLFVLAWNENKQSFDAHFVPRSHRYDSTMPYRESINNSMPRGMCRLEDFVTAARLRELARSGTPFVFLHPHTREKLIAIGAERIKIERWELLQIKWAPAGQ
ncbi:hypothetical protein ACFWN7_08905 [Agromyces sp. NPDC058484]|uniref:hypothetical protein n=1 Tax=Agromyces sp. NPDC058484 TaxID=3346524 RepID=UPI00364D45AE